MIGATFPETTQCSRSDREVRYSKMWSTAMRRSKTYVIRSEPESQRLGAEISGARQELRRNYRKVQVQRQGEAEARHRLWGR